jgi:hypothetical protein
LAKQRKTEEAILERICKLKQERKAIVNNGEPLEERKIALQEVDREMALLKAEVDALSTKTKNKTWGRIKAMVDFGDGPKPFEIIIKDRSPEKARDNTLFVSKDTDLACKLVLAKINSIILSKMLEIRILDKNF